MNTNNIDNISNDIYLLLLSLNKKILNPTVIFKSFNLPQSHVKVLFFLIHNGPTSISNIAKKLCISKPNMTPIIDKLVAEEYVTRYCDPNDRRVIIVKHSKKACEFFKKAEESSKNILKEKLITLDETELNTISTSINNLLELSKKI